MTIKTCSVKDVSQPLEGMHKSLGSIPSNNVLTIKQEHYAYVSVAQDRKESQTQVCQDHSELGYPPEGLDQQYSVLCTAWGWSSNFLTSSVIHL